MRLYSYIVKFDTGFAPNPFFGYCTLACCKPGIRRTAKIGDWIVGLTPRAQGTGNKIVYFMQVDERMGFDAYWRDGRFQEKRPNLHGGPVAKNGDNIYEPLIGGKYRQLPSDHSDPKCRQREDVESKEHDLKGEWVLVSSTFAYFGSQPIALPPELDDLKVGRSFKCKFSKQVTTEFRHFVSTQGFGVHAPPRKWPKDDHTWKVAAGGGV